MEETKDRSSYANNMIAEIHKADIPPAQKELFLKQALFTKDIATDVDNAHLRIDHRKEDIEKINISLASLTQKVEENTTYTKRQTEFTKKQTAVVNEMSVQMSKSNKRSLFILLVVSAFSLFLLFGGAEMLKRMGTLTTALKAAEIVTKVII